MEQVTDNQDAGALARSAIRYLAERRLAPTPENYSAAWRAVGGIAPDPQLAPRVAGTLLTRLTEAGGLDREVASRMRAALREQRWIDAETIITGSVSPNESVAWGDLIRDLIEKLGQECPVSCDDGEQVCWTAERKRQSLLRLLAVDKDPRRLHSRLSVLLESWERSGSQVREAGAALPGAVAVTRAEADARAEAEARAEGQTRAEAVAVAAGPLLPAHPIAADPRSEPAPQAAVETASARVAAAADEDCPRCASSFEQADAAERALGDSERTLDELRRLVQVLCQSLDAMVEEGSWIQGQIDMLRELLRTRASRFELASVRLLLEQVSGQQREIADRRRAGLRELKETLSMLVGRIGSLGNSTSTFADRIGGYAQAIEQAESLDGLADTVRSLLGDTRALRDEVEASRNEFAEAQERTRSLEQEVSRLETELARASERMLEDHLTQTLNRRGLEQAFAQAQQRARMFTEMLALALLDVDDFKRLNDVYGHQTGDRALVHLADMLQSRLRPGDTVARYGGEEFAILLPRNDAESAQVVVSRLQRELTRQVFLHESDQVFITFSAGVTSVSRDDALNDAVRRADRALYRAKRNGKNRVEIEDV